MKIPTYSEFVLRRLHSLTGVVPLTFFIFFHFFANSFSTLGEEAFDTVVAKLRGMPFLLAIEWGLLFAPFLFHMIFGLVIIFTARANPVRQSYARNWAYIMQRVTAIILFVFILYHVIGIRFIDAHGVDNVHALLHDRFSDPFTYWWYVVGITCTAYHLANGVCTFFMTWGITVGATAQRVTAYAMTGVGILVFALGIAALNGFVDNKPVKQPVKRTHTAETISTDKGAAPAL